MLYGLFALAYIFYPLAGCLADVKYGRYKTVICSLGFTAASGLILTIISSITTYYYFKLFMHTLSLLVGIATTMGLIVALSLAT